MLTGTPATDCEPSRDQEASNRRFPDEYVRKVGVPCGGFWPIKASRQEASGYDAPKPR